MRIQIEQIKELALKHGFEEKLIDGDYNFQNKGWRISVFHDRPKVIYSSIIIYTFDHSKKDWLPLKTYHEGDDFSEFYFAVKNWLEEYFFVLDTKFEIFYNDNV